MSTNMRKEVKKELKLRQRELKANAREFDRAKSAYDKANRKLAKDYLRLSAGINKNADRINNRIAVLQGRLS